MEADHSSDEEVFVGEITEKEKQCKQHSECSSRRRTTLYFPGVSRPDSRINVFEEITDDGTLIFSCEDLADSDTSNSIDTNNGMALLESEACVGSTDEDPRKAGTEPMTVLLNTRETFSMKLSEYTNTAGTPQDSNQYQADTNRGGEIDLKVKANAHAFQSHASIDSDYNSASDASFAGSLASPLSVTFTDHGIGYTSQHKENAEAAEDRKRKRCQSASPRIRTVVLQSPHLLVNPVALYPDPTCMPTAKKHIVCREMAVSGADSDKDKNSTSMSITNALLLNSQSAFSKMQLRSPDPKTKLDFGLSRSKTMSPIAKDFPQPSQRDSDKRPHVPMFVTPDADRSFLPMKRKIAQRSPSDELNNVDELSKRRVQLKYTERGQLENTAGLIPPPNTEIQTCSSSERESTLAVSASDRHSTSSEDSDVSVFYDQSLGAEDSTVFGPVAQYTQAVSSGGDARCDKRPQKPTRRKVFVPDTPDIKIKNCTKPCSRPTQDAGALENGFEIIPSSQITEHQPQDFESKSTPLAVLSAPLSPSKSLQNTSPISTPLRLSPMSDWLLRTRRSTPSGQCDKKGLRTKSCSRPNQDVGALEDSLFSVPSAPLSPLKKLKSAKPVSAPLSPMSDWLLRSRKTPPSGHDPKFSSYHNPASPDSPDLFSSPSFETLAHPSPAAGDPVRSPVPVSSVTKTLGSLRGLNHESLQSIEEDSAVSTQLGVNKENERTSTCSDVSSTKPKTSEHPSVTAVAVTPGAADESIRTPDRKVYKGATFADIQAYCRNGRKSPFGRPMPPRMAPRNSSNLRYVSQVLTQEELEEESKSAVTRVNTMMNGVTQYQLLDPESSPALLTEFPAPKEATRISWNEAMEEETPAQPNSPPPLTDSATPRSILQQRPVGHQFPFSKDPPSPIVLTRKRLQRFPRLFSDSS